MTLTNSSALERQRERHFFRPGPDRDRAYPVGAGSSMAGDTPRRSRRRSTQAEEGAGGDGAQRVVGQIDEAREDQLAGRIKRGERAAGLLAERRLTMGIAQR